VRHLHADLAALYGRLGEREQARQAYQDATAAIDHLAERLPEGETREAFVAAALARLPSQRAQSPRQAARDASGGLTEREREIAALIAAGASNAAIGGTLVISERTVETHVSNILAKLGFSSRAQIAAWATERGLSTPPS
jgi:DNA-binding NarL/FixJ family response regulator